MSKTLDKKNNIDAQNSFKEKIVEAIKLVYDPEIPVDVYELGLIYEINIFPINNVHILMTLTSPACPSAEEIPGEIKTRIKELEGVNEVNVEVTFEPPYATEMMSEAARLELGFL
ncbi:MAG: FeS assembly SUF system protein [Flammeovirgaceae bacterium]|nr:FeS assembly SUF system protein [Flammeovirgaceae bacterium]|tara:strand:- start:447 stop:791 length:345 start_codon:yes stop_codon:yes gene_type:complete